MMRIRNILAIILVALISLPGCTEEEKAEQMELWFGEPNIKRELAFLDPEPNDSQSIKSYKEGSKKIILKHYSGLRSVLARQYFLKDAIPSAQNELSIFRMHDQGLISKRDAAIMLHNARREEEMMIQNRELVDRLRW